MKMFEPFILHKFINKNKNAIFIIILAWYLHINMLSSSTQSTDAQVRMLFTGLLKPGFSILNLDIHLHTEWFFG